MQVRRRPGRRLEGVWAASSLARFTFCSEGRPIHPLPLKRCPPFPLPPPWFGSRSSFISSRRKSRSGCADSRTDFRDTRGIAAEKGGNACGTRVRSGPRRTSTAASLSFAGSGSLCPSVDAGPSAFLDAKSRPPSIWSRKERRIRLLSAASSASATPIVHRDQPTAGVGFLHRNTDRAGPRHGGERRLGSRARAAGRCDSDTGTRQTGRRDTADRRALARAPACAPLYMGVTASRPAGRRT